MRDINEEKQMIALGIVLPIVGFMDSLPRSPSCGRSESSCWSSARRSCWVEMRHGDTRLDEATDAEPVEDVNGEPSRYDAALAGPDQPSGEDDRRAADSRQVQRSDRQGHVVNRRLRPSSRSEEHT